MQEPPRERAGAIDAWERQWHEAEDDYLARVVTPGMFDWIIDPNEDLDDTGRAG